MQSQDVILDFNGQKVAGTKELQGIVERMDVGKTYNMTVLRDGKQMTIPVTVEAMPSDTATVARDEDENGSTKEKTRDSVAVERSRRRSHAH